MGEDDDKQPLGGETGPETAGPELPPASEAAEAGPETQQSEQPAPPPAGGGGKRKSPKKPAKPKKKRSWARRILVWALIVLVAIPVGLTLVYRFVPPPITILMVQRLGEGRGLQKSWRPLSQISPSLVQSVIAAEDARFCSHHGFDLTAIEQALRSNERGTGVMRGGSTISQQTAKNVFLWPQRDWVRKGLETYFTVLIEGLWGKRRIMEVYLNVAEWGSGTYGAEAAARRYFDVPASRLTRTQSARLAAVLPSPLRYRAVAPGPYVARRSRSIGAAAGTVRQEDLADCIG